MSDFSFPPKLRLRHISGTSPLKFALIMVIILAIAAATLIGMKNLTEDLWQDWQIKQPLAYPAAQVDDKNSRCRTILLAISHCSITIKHPGGVLEKNIIFLSDFGDYKSQAVYDRDHPGHISDSLSQEKIYQRLAVALVLWALILFILAAVLPLSIRRYWRLVAVTRRLNEERARWQLAWQPLPDPNNWLAQKFPLTFDGRPRDLFLMLKKRPLWQRGDQVLTLRSGTAGFDDYYAVIDEKLSVFAGLNKRELAQLREDLADWCDRH